VQDARRLGAIAAVAGVHAGFRLDLRPHSLWEVDRLVDATNGSVEHVLGDPEGRGHAVFALGGYLGEVLRQGVRGTWVGDDDDPDRELNVAIRLRSGALVWPVQRVMKRVALGSEEAIAAYGSLLGLDIGPPPSPPGFWARYAANARFDRNPSVIGRVRRARHERARSR
jgi:hypothetical protein